MVPQSTTLRSHEVHSSGMNSHFSFGLVSARYRMSPAGITIARFCFLFFFPHIYVPASGQAVVTGVVPSPPRLLSSIFIAVLCPSPTSPALRESGFKCLTLLNGHDAGITLWHSSRGVGGGEGVRNLSAASWNALCKHQPPLRLMHSNVGTRVLTVIKIN